MAIPKTVQSSMVLLIGVLFINGCESQIQCVQTGTCTCQFNDQAKTVVNLGTIGLRNGKPKFPFDTYGSTGNFLYSFNPCYAYSVGTCIGVVSCQKFTGDPNPSYFDLGDPAPETWTTDSNGVIVVTYSAGQGDQKRESEVSYTCEATALEPTLEGIVEYDTRKYRMTLKTCAACSPAVAGCPTNVPSASSGGITGGGIVCILFTVFVLVYFIGGAMFMKFAQGASGKEVIPNYKFWSDFPILVKDGFFFMLSPCRKGGYADIST